MKINFEHTNPSYNAFLNLLKSPENESSLLKNIPLPLLASVKKLVREVFPNYRFFVKYRGPRQSAGTTSGYCRKNNAKSAALYFHRVSVRDPNARYGWSTVIAELKK